MHHSSRSRFIWLVVTAALVVAILFLTWREPTRPAITSTPEPASGKIVSSSSGTSNPSSSAGATSPPFGEQILAGYANPARPPEEDLHAIARMLGNFTLLVKGDDPLPLGANEEIAAALRGKNKAALRALPDDHRAFNARGQLIDRWGAPLYFHAQSRDRLEVRSAGPDRTMWTADDLHRMQDGRFLRGEALLAPSLFGSSK